VPGQVISRPRLLSILDLGAPLTVVRGAVGTGKTVLLHEWVQATDDKVLWVTADPEHPDSRTLALTILERLRPDDHAGLGLDAGWRSVRSALTEDDRVVTMIVDDAAALERQALLDLCDIVATVPSFRVIAAANQPTVLDGEGVGLMLDRVVIDPTQLMFDAEEVRRALGVGDDTATQILAETNGFPAVIHALAKRGARGDVTELLAVAVEAVEDFMHVRLGRSGYGPERLRTLVMTSFPEELDAELAVSLSGNADASNVLDEAEHNGVGSWRSTPQGRLFRYAPFARALLRRELERAYTAQIPEMRRAVVEWCLRLGKPGAALRIASEDHAELSLARHVVMSAWHELLMGHGHVVRSVLGGMPMSTLKREPLLVMLLAICYNAVRVRRLRGLQLFRIAVSAANSQASDLPAVDRLFIWVAESTALRLLGMRERAAAVAVRALRLMADTPDDEKETYAHQVPLLCAQLGISLYYGGHERQALESFAFGAAMATAAGSEHALSNLAMLSGIHALNGDIPEARHYVELIREGQWRRLYLDGYQGTFYRVAEAVLALEESDASRAAQHVAAFQTHRATSEHWVTMANVEAMVALARGNAALGSAQLESLVHLRGREGASSHVRRALTRTRVLLQLAMGNTAAAKSMLQKGVAEDGFEVVIERARVALIDGRPRDAIRVLSQSGAPARTARERAAVGCIRTAALIRTGGPATARHDAQVLGALLIDRELRWPLALLPASDARAVRDLLRDEVGIPIEPVSSVLPDSLTAPALTDREMVVLRALASDRPLSAIATELGVSLNTVKTQVKSVYRKLDVTGREEAVAAATARDLIRTDV
jgi:LuxR family maltose regulon positive regulatory protein